LDISRVITYMHRHVGGCLGRVCWRFVGRDVEASKILRWEFGSADILVVGCARGCGKSAFADAFSCALAESGEAESMLIMDTVGYLRASKGAWKLAEETSKREEYKLVKRSSNDNMVSGYLRDRVRGFVYDVVEAAEGSELEGRLFIFIDGVYLYVKKDAESYRLWLDGMDDAILHNRLKKGTAKIVIMTSGDSMATWSIVPHMAIYVRDAMMWNLPRRDFEALADTLELKDHPELLWSLTGGNPEALVAIWDRSLRGWLKFEISRLGNMLMESIRESGEEELWREVEELLSLPEFPPKELSDRMRDAGMLAKIERYNRLTEIPEEQWVGKHYAFPIPAHYHILKIITRKRSTDIEPEEVIREAMG
jgi:hypothetical protein